MSDVVLFDKRGTTGVVTINRPRALNALNRAVIDGLHAVFDGPANDPELRAIVLCGAGGKAFVAGADIAEMSTIGVLEAEQFAGHGQALGDKIARFPLPVIAAVGGFALGGGCELAMACDIVLAGPRAKFGQPEVNLGVIPGFGGTQRLLRRAGLAVAMDLCLTGRLIKAQEAVNIGIASRVVELEDGQDILDAALAVAGEIAQKGPVAVRLAKRVLHENADADLAAGLAAERSAFAMCFATSDQKEGMAAFVGKRAANFEGK